MDIRSAQGMVAPEISKTRMTFLSLPDELLSLIVASALDDCPYQRDVTKELLSFLRVCSRLYFASLPLLYAKIVITTEHALHGFLSMVRQRADLASYVKSLCVSWVSCYYPPVDVYHRLDDAGRMANEAARAEAIFVNDAWRTRRIPQLPNCSLLELYLAQDRLRIDAAMPFFELLRWLELCPSLRGLSIRGCWTASGPRSLKFPEEFKSRLPAALSSYRFDKDTLESEGFKDLFRCFPTPSHMNIRVWV
jgi:hypothetical protein